MGKRLVCSINRLRCVCAAFRQPQSCQSLGLLVTKGRSRTNVSYSPILYCLCETPLVSSTPNFSGLFPTHQPLIHAVSLHLIYPLPGTFSPLLPPNTSLCLLLATYKLMPAPAFILNALAPPAFYFDLSSYCKMCVVSLCPASSGLLLGGDLCCSLPYPQVLTHGLAHNKCPCRLVR